MDRLIVSAKRNLYSLIGCSLYKTNLSPTALSRLYWSVCVPKFLSCAEVTCYNDIELDVAENFHKSMAKEIQNLPKCTANPVILSTLGWKSITTHLRFIREMFVWMSYNCLCRQFFIRCCTFIMNTGKFRDSSPISLLLKV